MVEGARSNLAQLHYGIHIRPSVPSAASGYRMLAEISEA